MCKSSCSPLVHNTHTCNQPSQFFSPEHFENLLLSTTKPHASFNSLDTRVSPFTLSEPITYPEVQLAVLAFDKVPGHLDAPIDSGAVSGPNLVPQILGKNEGWPSSPLSLSTAMVESYGGGSTLSTPDLSLTPLMDISASLPLTLSHQAPESVEVVHPVCFHQSLGPSSSTSSTPINISAPVASTGTTTTSKQQAIQVFTLPGRLFVRAKKMVSVLFVYNDH